MKSPDEIKKGLHDRIRVHYHPGDHEPRLTPLELHELEALHADAFICIHQLEAERDKAVNALTISLFRQDEITCCSFCKNKNGCERNPYGTSRCFVWEGMPTT